MLRSIGGFYDRCLGIPVYRMSAGSGQQSSHRLKRIKIRVLIPDLVALLELVPGPISLRGEGRWELSIVIVEAGFS